MQIFKNSVFSFLRSFLSFFLLFIFPTIAFTQDFGVNIDRIYYRDNSGREIDYDFSAGIIDEYGTIVIPASAVKLVPDSETNTTFLWEQGFRNQQVSFSEGVYQISVPQSTDTIKPIPAVTTDIILDGSEADWSGVAGYIEDHLNDVAQWVPAGSGADMHYLKVAFSPNDSKLYILMKLNDPVSQDAWYRLFLDKDLDGELDESGDYQIDIQYNNTSSSWEVVSQGWNSDGTWYQVEESGTVVVSDQIIEVSVSTGAFGLPADVVISGRTMQDISPYRTYDTFSNNYLEAEGFCSMGGSGVTAPLPSEWQFSARISNFSNVLFENNHFYGVSIGGGSSDPDDLEPSVWADWFSGTHNGINYQNALVFGAEVENALGGTDEYHWEWHVEDGGGLVLSDLEPASTVLDLKLVVTSGGQTLSAYYRINSDSESGWTLLFTHTLSVDIGTIYGFYDIYPTIGLETGVENKSIATETDVTSFVGCVFPIAVTSGGEFGLNAAFDGTNYLAGIQGNEIASNNIAAQMVSQAGTLVGSTISIGRTGGLPHVAFDGVNYLLVWEDDANYPNDEIYGQFISQSGTLKGYPFPINQDASDDELYGITFDGSNYLVVWKNLLDGGNEAICGQMVSQTEILVGSNILISGESLNQNWAATAFDGANYLIVWSDGTRLSTGLAEDIYGQFVTTAGGLVGQKFLIDQNDYPSDNFISIGFDGARYLVLFQDRINGEYDIYCRSVSTSGSIGDRIAISDTTGNQKFPSIAFDGNNYFITMSDDMGGTSITAKGRFYNVELNPLGDWFTLFEASGSKIPFASSVIFDGSKYLIVATTAIISGDDVADGDVYGVFVHPGSVGGDINNDKAVDLVDAILALKALVGLCPVGINLGADVNGDNKIGLAEVIYVLQSVAGLRSAQISNIPPHATINIPASDATFNMGQVVDFEGNGLDTDGQVVAYKWSFGDESIGCGQSTSHSYNRPGSYTVTLIVTDDNGATGVDSITVDVETIWYKDADGDGYSDGTTQNSVSRPSSEYYESSELTAISGDCNDNDVNIHPGATEICGDGIDQNCDGSDLETEVLFIDDFSSDLAAWTDMRGNNWSITDNELYGDYGISCGSTVCPQADLILNDEYQPSGNYRASVDFIRTVDASHSHADYFQAIGNFALWQDSNNKISISIGGSGWDFWGGQQSQIQVNVQEWDGSWETTLSETLDYVWDPDEWHTASIEKRGNIYSFYIDGVYFTQYEDTFLNGEGKIGLHTYGSKTMDNFRLETVNTAWENGFTISEVASFPVGLVDHACSRIGDKIYVMGGRKILDPDSLGADEIYEFDTNNNQLNLLSDTLPYGMLWSMSSAVAGNGRIYLGPAGGPELRNGWGVHSKIVEYDTNTGIAIEKQVGYGTNMWGVSMAADSNGFIYLFGGHNGSDQNTIYKYDHNSDTMNLVSNLSYSTTGGAAILGANKKIYYFDVCRTGHKVTLFDPSNNATSDVATIPSGFSFVGGAGKAGWADGENIYLLLVDDNENELRLFKFNTQTNEVTDTAQTIALSITRFSVVKHNDNVYIFGGYDFVNESISNKIYKLSISESTGGWQMNRYNLARTQYYPFSSSVSADWSEMKIEANLSAQPTLTSDVNGDGSLEILANNESSVFCFSGSGTQLWQSSSFLTNNLSLTLSADVMGDNIPEVLVGFRDSVNNLKVAVLSGSGTTLATHIVRADARYDSSVSPFAFADIDNNGEKELLLRFGSGYSCEPRGPAVWDFNSQNLTWYFDIAGCGDYDAIGNLDSNDDMEWVVGQWTCHNGCSGAGSDGDFSSFIVDSMGNQLHQITYSSNGSTNGGVLGAIDDLDGDGVNDVIIYETHDPTYYPGTEQVHIINPSTGLISASVDLDVSGDQGLGAIADIDADGNKEIIIAAPVIGKVRVLSNNLVVEREVSGIFGRVKAVADLTGDGNLEIILAWGKDLRLLDKDLNLLSSYSFENNISEVLVSDVDGDGVNELVVGGRYWGAIVGPK